LNVIEPHLDTMIIWFAAAAALAASPTPSTSQLPLPPALGSSAGGDFVDRQGTHHRWEINKAHALLWDGKAFVPAGVLLHLPADARPPSPDAGRVEAGPPGLPAAAGLPPGVSSTLERAAAQGVKDVCVVRSGGWLAADAAADQALVDGLEARGMRYGIALDARPDRPLVGYLAAPTRVEVPADWRQAGRRVNWSVDLPGARGALFALIDVDSDTVIATGRVPVADGKARIEVALRPSRRMFAPGAARLLVVPEEELVGPPEQRPVDFWSGWEDVQQQLASRLAAVKWGPGLRFFARLAPAAFGLRGEVEELVPVSGGFHLQFESWMERRYSVSDLNNQWGLNDRQVTALSVAARLVPLWARGERGEKSGWLLDPATGEWYRVDLRRCAFWRDFEEFRTDSIRRALNSTATLLKKVAADVPIVGEWTEYHPLFTDPEVVGGIDGLAFASQGWGREAAIGSAAYAYAQAEGSARPTWFLQLGQRSGGSAPPGSAEELRLDWNWLREIGCKGFYADGVSAAAPAPAASSETPMAAAPASSPPGAGTPEGSPDWDAPAAGLDWIRDFGANVAGGDAVAGYRPAVLYFPSGAVGLGLTGRLDSGVWWLPSFAQGQRLELGEEMEGYWIDRSPDPAPAGAARAVVVLWCPSAPQKATFVTPPDATVGVYDALGRPLQPAGKHRRVQVPLASDPVIVTGLSLQYLFPVETTAEALREFESLTKAAEAQKLDVAPFRLTLNDAKALFTPATAATTYALLRAPLESLRAALTPYIWIEGEAAARHNWNGIQPDPHASAGAVLHLDHPAAAEGILYQARYPFRIERQAPYDLWLAGSVPGSPRTSPFTWRIDERAPSLAGTEGESHRYAGALGWTRLGQVPLAPGPHVLILTATGPAASGGYHLDVDALVLSREPFQPNGVRRPDYRVARDLGSRQHATR
jgi:hypothetical protein